MSTNPLDTAIAELEAEMERNVTVGASAVAYIKGVPGLIQTAIDQAVANGVKPAQLAAMTELKNKLTADTAALTEALTTNTPEPPIE